MYSTLLIFPPMSGKYIPKEAIETVTMARIVTSDLSFASIVVPPRTSTRNSQAPTGPLRDVTFSEKSQMVVVSSDNTRGPDPEVHMDEWVDTQVIEIPLTRVASPPQVSYTTTRPPATIIAGTRPVWPLVLAQSLGKMFPLRRIPTFLNAQLVAPAGQ
jgi:hypothetical protein